MEPFAVGCSKGRDSMKPPSTLHMNILVFLRQTSGGQFDLVHFPMSSKRYSVLSAMFAIHDRCRMQQKYDVSLTTNAKLPAVNPRRRQIALGVRGNPRSFVIAV